MGYSDETSASEARGLQRERRDLEVQRCAAAEDVCGRQVACVFALTTALALMGLDWTPLTTGVTRRRLRPEYLQVVVGPSDLKPEDRIASKRHGRVYGRFSVTYFKSGIPLKTIEVAPGVTCTSCAFTWLMFAQWLDLEELVKLGDAMMSRYTLHEMMTIQDFVDFLDWVDEYARRNHRYAPRGIMKCRKALPLMAQGTDSVAETMLRLILIRYGLPIPCVNYQLVLRDGSLVFLDLAYPEAKIDIEYDGRHHRYQWARDAQRTMKIRAEGWEYFQVTSEMLSDDEQMFMVVVLVARCLKERTGKDYLLPQPLTLEQAADQRRAVWHG